MEGAKNKRERLGIPAKPIQKQNPAYLCGVKAKYL